MTWKRTRLKHLCTDSGQYGLNIGSDQYQDTGIRLVRTSDVTANGQLREQSQGVFISGAIEKRYMLKPGDLLLSRSGTLGRAFLAKTLDAPTTFAGYLVRFRPLDGVDPRFLYYCTVSRPFQSAIQADAVASTIQNFNAERYANVELCLPGLGEQQRIADFLDTESARMNSLATHVEKARTLLLERLRYSRSEELGVLPGREPPRTVPLKYLAQRVSVGIVVTPARWYVDDGGILALRGLNVRAGGFQLQDVVYISREGHALHRKSQLRFGDVVVVRTGQAGAAAVVPTSIEGANCIDLVIIRLGASADPYFVEQLLNSDYASRYVEEFSVGSIQAHLNVGAMKQLPIPMVPIDEQRRRVRRVREHEEDWVALDMRMSRQLELLHERRQALITAAVTGQFDVTSGRGMSLS